MSKKIILLIGGLGTIGQVLTDGLSDVYEVIIADKLECPKTLKKDYVQIDVTDYSQLIDRIPQNTNAIINLTGIAGQPKIVGTDMMSTMTDLYVMGAYNVYLAAAELKINKVIFASSNHVTDYYEKDGSSLLRREISTENYPLSESVYGVLKLTGEGLGHVFSINRGLSVICIRIGTVRLDEYEVLQISDRFRKTLLSKIDAIDLFTSAIEAEIRFGVFYGVSNNPGKPWSISNAIQEMGYKPSLRSIDILRQGN